MTKSIVHGNDAGDKPVILRERRFVARESLSTVFKRALGLRCPRCGEGKLFAGWFRMHAGCSHCRLHYERAPGYFLGSTYINYGVTSLTLTAMYFALHFGAGYSNRMLAVPLTLYCVLLPALIFRHARSFWMAMDCYFDTVGFKDDGPSDRPDNP